MGLIKILFDLNGHAKSHIEISKKIIAFGDSYNNAAKEIIDNSKVLDKDGDVFIKCAARILSNFGMTRSGPFFGNYKDKLLSCWNVVGDNLSRN